MKFLLTNDDGIDAPGLAALVNAARTLGDPIVVAPAGPQSGVSHAVTWHDGVRIEPRGEKSFRDPRDAGRLYPPRTPARGAGRKVDPERNQPRRESRR